MVKGLDQSSKYICLRIRDPNEKNFKRLKEAMDGYGMSMRRLVLMVMMLLMPISSSRSPCPSSSSPCSLSIFTCPSLFPLMSDAFYSKPICYLNCTRKYLNLIRSGIYGHTVMLCVRIICNRAHIDHE